MQATIPFGTALATRYKAERLTDGRIVVHDVPLYSEILPTDPRVRAKQGVPRGRNVLARFLETFKARHELTGYLPPMNLRHFFNQPERVGNFWPKDLRLAAVNPHEAPRWTLFGALIFGDDPKSASAKLSGTEAFEKAKGYDFRSVEISPDAPDELDCLALLRESAPAHKYPALSVESFQAWGNKECFQSVVASPLAKRELNAAAVDNPFAVANSMVNKGEIPAKGPKKEEVIRALKRESSQDKEVAMGDDKEPKGDGDMPPWAKELSASMKEMCESHKALYAALMPKKEDPDNDGDKHEPEAAEASAPEPSSLPAADRMPAVMQTAPGEKPPERETFATRLEVHQLRGVVQKLTREREAMASVEAGAQKLADLGIPMTPEYKRELFAAALEDPRAIEREINSTKRILGMAGHTAPENGTVRAFGTFGGGRTPDPEPLKKALEAFGARPGAEPFIRELYAECAAEPRMQRHLADFARFVSVQPEIAGKNGRG